MPAEADGDLWQALIQGGDGIATEEDYEHGYAREVRGDLQQYVVFSVAGERYGVTIGQIGEIAKPLDTTPVPRTADFVVGIGNVRGVVIPVLDLSVRLKLGPSQRTRDTRILIVRHDDEQYGLVVDRVFGVAQIAPEDLEETPGALPGQRAEFIHALARSEGDIIIVLDLASLLNPHEFLGPTVHSPRRTETMVGPRRSETVVGPRRSETVVGARRTEGPVRSRG
jgi:purine-binding chemotaxis protein CheW